MADKRLEVSTVQLKGPIGSATVDKRVEVSTVNLHGPVDKRLTISQVTLVAPPLVKKTQVSQINLVGPNSAIVPVYYGGPGGWVPLDVYLPGTGGWTKIT